MGRVMKFGGSSLASARALEHVLDRILEGDPAAVVVSAPGGLTDALVQLSEAPEPARLSSVVDAFRALDEEVVEAMDLEERLTHLLADRDGDPVARRDEVLSLGERFSAAWVSGRLRARGQDAFAVDAPDFLRAQRVGDEVVVDGRLSRQQLLEQRATWSLGIPVVTGFLGRRPDGEIVTLGREGSDWTATLLAAWLGADEVQLWTDVAGILSGDPRAVDAPHPVPRLSFQSAARLTARGARVLHRRTLHPLRGSAVRVRVAHTQRPEAGFTELAEVTADQGFVVSQDEAYVWIAPRKGLTLQALQRSFPLAVDRIVGSPEAGFGIPSSHWARRGKAAARLGHLSVEPFVGVTWIIGEGLGNPLDSLAPQDGERVRGGGQGAWYLVGDPGRLTASHVHQALHAPRAHVVLLGWGKVGRALAKVLHEAPAGRGVRLWRVVSARGEWQGEGAERSLRSGPVDRAAVLDALAELEHPIVIDASGGDTADWWDGALSRGISVVTANKKPLAEAQWRFERWTQTRWPRGARLLHETTVGAGLPVVRTLEDIVATGDEVQRIEGCLSGTLGYLCDQLMHGAALDDALRSAERLGYTEPYPGDDLSGEDVVRKALILARVAGLSLEPSAVHARPLVPPSVLRGPPEGLWGRLRAWHKTQVMSWAARIREGERLVYLAEVDVARERVAVGPRWVGPDHPAHGLVASDALVVFRTRRYLGEPMRVVGPGAGPYRTAAGLLGDVLQLVPRRPVGQAGRPGRAIAQGAQLEAAL